VETCESCGQPVGDDGYRDTENGIALCAACDETCQEEARQAWEGERQPPPATRRSDEAIAA